MENSKSKNKIVSIGTSPTIDALKDQKDRALEQAIDLISQMRQRVYRTENLITQHAIGGKDKYHRDVGLHNAQNNNRTILRKFADWLEHANNLVTGIDVHTGQGKHHKLNLVGDKQGDLADYSANNSRAISKNLNKDKK